MYQYKNKVTINAKRREKYAKNPEADKKIVIEHRKENPEHYIAYQREHRSKNLKKGRIQAKQRYKLKRNRILGQQQAYHSRNPEAITRRSHIRRARVNSLPDNWTTEDQKKILEFFDYRCALTGSSDASMDHIIAIGWGRGGTTKETMLPLDSRLNFRKGTRNMFTWAENEIEQGNIE